MRHPRSYIQGRDRELSVPIPGTVSRGCALQCAIISPTFKVGTGNSLYPYLVESRGCALQCAILIPTFNCVAIRKPAKFCTHTWYQCPLSKKGREHSVHIPGTGYRYPYIQIHVICAFQEREVQVDSFYFSFLSGLE